jgi:hypothetical protein
LLFQYYGWVLVVAVLGYLIWRNRQRAQWFTKTDFEIIKLDLAKTAGNNSAAKTEQLLTALHGIYKPRKNKFIPGDIQEHLSLELSAKDGHTNFYIWLPQHLHELVASHLKAQYPGIIISVLEKDYL